MSRPEDAARRSTGHSPDNSGDQALWDRLARGWEKWWPLQERALGCVNDSLLRLASVAAGHRVLDVGTGIGEPALAAGVRVGLTGSVVAMDCSPQMLGVARKRVLEAGLPNVTFLESGVDGLDFPEGSFDAILCRFSLMFLPDLQGALATMKSLLRQGGVFAASVWDEAAKTPMLSLPLDLAHSYFGLPPSQGAQTIYSLAGGRLEESLAAAGFRDISSESLACAFEAASPGEYAQFLSEVNAPLATLLAGQPGDLRAGYWRGLESRLQPFLASDGKVILPGSVLCAAGTR